VDENNRKLPINLRSIGVDTAFQTRAVGRIAEEQDFQLSPAFDFFGDVHLTASIKELTFEGSTRIQHGCEGLARNWMRFNAAIDPLEVFIPVGDTLLDDKGERIGAGAPHRRGPLQDLRHLPEPHQEQGRPQRDHRQAGLLFYDKGRKEYVISNKDKIRQRNLPGDLVSLAVENCVVMGDGPSTRREPGPR
jgi:hypothetical protein